MAELFADLQWRGLIHQATDEDRLRELLNQGGRTVYAGFDPTSDSLHVGSLVPLMYLRRFQRAGHRVIALVGGATGMIGDPSGKSEERNLLDADALRRNVEGIGRQMQRFLRFDGDNGALLLNNFDWMQRFSYLDFLREVGKHFPVNVMMAKDSVRSRLERDEVGISYTEFSYMLLQAYDFYYLNRHYGCEIQLGGSDQWGNITAGIDLTRRMKGPQLYGITCPLLLTSTGQKMGKTEQGTVWLAPEKTSPYQFYQYWLNVADEDAGRCLRMLTELPREEIEALDRARTEAPQKRDSQRRLAEALTRLVHGDEGLAAAQQATAKLFHSELSNLSDAELMEAFSEVPSRELARERLTGEGLGLLDAFCEAGLAASKGEARRIVQQGGAYVNDQRRDDPNARLTEKDLAGETVMVLRSGKKKYALLRFLK
jgi:tyrosyl-tRNA synthetase